MKVMKDRQIKSTEWCQCFILKYNILLKDRNTQASSAAFYFYM